MSRPDMYRGRVWCSQKYGWHFADDHSGFIAEEVREDREDSHKNNPFQTFEAMHRLFKPSDFEKRKR